jgi:hypothetical protein
MKTFFLAGILLGFASALQSQSIMDNLFEKYSGMEGYTSVYISKYMFDMFRGDQNDQNNQKSEDDLEKVISKLDGIKILVTDDDPATPAPVNLYKEIMKVIPASPYKEIMVVKEKDKDIKFFVKESKDNRIDELLMVIGGIDENVLISIIGDIDMKNISRLARTMNVEGMENLEKIK